MDQQSEREYVESMWQVVVAGDFPLYEPCPFNVSGGELNTKFMFVLEPTEAEAWHAAYLFTLSREQEIAEIEEEIEEIQMILNLGHQGARERPFKRTIGRLQLILADKRKGMKQ